MGIIRRQGFKRAIVAYVAAVMGAIASLFIYPLAFEVYGEIRFVLSVAMFLYPLMGLGVNSLPVRFFPEFTEGKSNRGFLPLLTLLFVLSLAVTGLSIFLFQDGFLQLLAWIGFTSDQFLDKVGVIAGVVLLLGLGELVKRYTTNLGRIVVPELISSTLWKFVLPIFILLVFLEWVPVSSFKVLLLGFYGFSLLVQLLYVYCLGKLEWKIDFSFLNRALGKRMLAYAMYGLVGSLGSVMAFNIDVIMVSGLEGFNANGRYSNALNFASFISVPQVAIAAIAGPIISKAIFEKKWKEVGEIYQQSSLNLGMVGLLIFILIVVNLEDLFQLSTNTGDMITLWWPVFILGSAKVIDMLGGTNREIMGYSHLYKYNLLFVLILAVSNTMANLILIPDYGITGAALATFISLSLINVIRGGFLYYRLGLQPFTKGHLGAIALAAITLMALLMFPLSNFPIINILVRSALATGVLLGANMYFNWSPLMNDGLHKIAGMVGLRLPLKK